MNLKDKRPVTVISVLLLLAAGSTVATGQQTPFEQLINRFEEGQVFHAKFTYEQSDSYTGETTSSEGALWVADDRYRVYSDRKTIIVDGENSRVYDENRNRVIVSSYEPEEDDFAPSRFLSGVDSTYAVAEQRIEDENTIITFESQDPFSVFKSVEVTLGPGLIPLIIFTVDQVDTRSTTVFHSGSFKSEREGLFLMEYPDDAEVIDMRN